MKRWYGVLVLVVLIAGLLGAVRWRESWIDGVMREQRADQLKSATPRWPALNGGPHANRPVDTRADE